MNGTALDSQSLWPGVITFNQEQAGQRTDRGSSLRVSSCLLTGLLLGVSAHLSWASRPLQEQHCVRNSPTAAGWPLHIFRQAVGTQPPARIRPHHHRRRCSSSRITHFLAVLTDCITGPATAARSEDTQRWCRKEVMGSHPASDSPDLEPRLHLLEISQVSIRLFKPWLPLS